MGRGVGGARPLTCGSGRCSPAWDVGVVQGPLALRNQKMRSNAMKTCALGAMLFGGTLGAAQQASAGLVWTDSVTYHSYGDPYGTGSYGIYSVTQQSMHYMSLQGIRDTSAGGSGGFYAQAFTDYLTGSAVRNATSISAGPVAGPLSTYSASKTAATAAGFSVSLDYAQSYPAGTSYLGGAMIELAQCFTVTAGSTVTVTLTLNAPGYAGSNNVRLMKVVPLGPDFGWPDGTSGLQNQLPFSMNFASSVTTLTLTEGDYQFYGKYNFSELAHSGMLFDFAVVPAPGAVALLGAAGLAGGRRRRA